MCQRVIFTPVCYWQYGNGHITAQSARRLGISQACETEGINTKTSIICKCETAKITHIRDLRKQNQTYFYIKNLLWSKGDYVLFQNILLWKLQPSSSAASTF